MLPFMATKDAARDMDRMREALGEAKLSYFGFSYGTFLGTVYAGCSRITSGRSCSTARSTRPPSSSGTRPRRSAFAALTAFLDDCKADTTCAFHNNGDPTGAYDKLMAVDRREATAGDRHPGRPAGRAGRSVHGVLYALYSEQSWPILAQGLALAQEGDGSVCSSWPTRTTSAIRTERIRTSRPQTTP